MINGMRRGHSINGNGVPINFNSVESVNIVKGPAGAVYGTSNYVGGYSDLITKRAYFDFGGAVEYTYGSFDQHTVDLDVNYALSDTLAFRTSMQFKEWEGFWDRWYDKSQSYYATLAWRPNETYSLDIMGEYYKGNYTENWGINRVTQDLLDNGTYIPSFDNAADWAAFYASQPPRGFGNFPGVPLDPDSAVQVRREGKLAAPGDDSNADVFWLQAIQNFNVSDDFKIINNTYFHYKDRETFSSYHYSEYLPENWSLENRLQVVQELETTEMEELNLTYGVRLKYQEITSVNHFFNEPVNYFDMTQDPETFRIPDSSFDFPPLVFSGRSSRGVLDYWYVGGFDPTGATAEAFSTESFITSPFIQADFKFTDKISMLVGGTVDWLDHAEGTPSEVKLLDKNGTVGDTSDDILTDLDYSKTDSSGTFYNWNASFIYKPTEQSSVYFTYNAGEHYGSNTGGSIDENTLDGLDTELIELGSNVAFLDDKAYVGVALFRQEYTTRNQDSTIDVIETDGFEIEFNYQPNSNFFATIGYSYLDSVRSAGFFATATPADESGTLWLTPTFPSFADGQKFEAPGVPPHLFNALVQYKFDNGFGLQANTVYTSEMQAGYDGASITSLGTPLTLNTLQLDSQYEVDFKAFYEWNSWRFEFSVFNVTDEENWDLPNTGYALGSVVARPERSYELSARYTF